MHRFLISTLIILGLFGCTDEVSPQPEAEVVSRWLLEEVLGGPGDGSGTFQPVNSEKTIAFLSDNTLAMFEGTLCELRSAEGVQSRATYSQEQRTITPHDCDFALTYSIVDDHLIVVYPCFEPCAERYRRVLTLAD